MSAAALLQTPQKNSLPNQFAPVRMDKVLRGFVKETTEETPKSF